MPVAISLVANAEKSIYIASFKLELSPKHGGLQLMQFFNILHKKSIAGIDVRILTNHSDNRGHIPTSNAYALRFFKQTHMPVKVLPNDRIVHAKLLIVDNRWAILGSHNLSVKSCHNNFEVSFLLTDEGRVRVLQYIYEKLWSTAKDG